MLRDLSSAFRALARTPGLFASACLALALGIGANGTMLGVADALLFRPPAHVRDAASLRRVYLVDPHAGPQGIVAYPTYERLAGNVAAFSGLAASAYAEASIGRGESAREVSARVVTPSFFTTLGVEPARGRLFTAAEGDPERPGAVALVSWELWQRAWGGRPEVLGKILAVGKDAYTVVGVLPRGFTGVDLEAVDLWLPIGAAGRLQADPGWSRDSGRYFLSLVARLRPGASPAQAAEQATAVLRDPVDRGSRRAQPVVLGAVQEGRDPLAGAEIERVAWLTATSSAALLIACLNVASLLVARGLDRRRELAVRLALGAGRGAILRLLVAEGLALALAGGALGYATSRAGGALASAYLLPDGAQPAGFLDLRLLAIFAALVLGAGILAGLPSGLAASRADLATAMGTGGRLGGTGRSRLRAAFLAAQVALTTVLLVGAGLFVASLLGVRSLRLGMEPDRVLVASVNLASAGYPESEVDRFYARALARLRHLPGVARASVATGIPFRSYNGTSLSVPGRGFVNGLAPGGVSITAVAGDYFAALGEGVRRGRPLTDADGRGTERVAVVNETAARLLWPGRDPLGECIQIGGDEDPCAAVVGVAEDARVLRLLPERPAIQLFVPLAQAPAFLSGRALFVRAAGAPEALGGAIRREMQAVAPGLPFVRVELLADLVEPQARPWKTGAVLFSAFGLLAATLSVIGVFAAVAQGVAARRQEVGVRLALGARERDVARLVLGHGLAPAALGVAGGIAVAALAAARLQPLLFGISAGDPRIQGTAAIALLAAAFLASYLPALRARRVDPASVLRAE